MAIDTTTTTPTRRAMLAGIAVLPALGVAGQLSAATDDPEWRRLVAEWKEARADMLEVGKRYNAAEDRYFKATKPAEPQRPTPPKLSNLDGSINADAVKSVVSGPYYAANAAYEESHRTWREETNAMWKRIVGPTEAEWEEAVDRSGAAALRVLRHPVRTHQQLTEKLHVLQTEFDGFGSDPDDRGAIIADVRRLMGKAS